MEWTPGPRAASRLMRVLHRKEVQNISTFLKSDGTSTCPGEDTADLLFRTHFPQSTPSHLPHYDHTPFLTSTIMEHFKPVLLLHLPLNIVYLLWLSTIRVYFLSTPPACGKNAQ